MNRSSRASDQRRVDLHLHSTCSDGRLRPAEVMAAVKKAGLAAAALTDHDTVAGIEEAARVAGELDLDFAPGIELSTHDESGPTHVLGYFLDPENEALADHVVSARQQRRVRAGQIVEKLNRLGVGVTVDDVVAEASGGLVARSHIARAMLAGGWISHYGEAFNRYIGTDGPAYVPTQRLTPAAGIALIHEAGGLAVLAHPGHSHGPPEIRDLVDAGLDGIETMHPEHGPDAVAALRALAEELALLETGGSDWHGPRNGKDEELSASRAVPYSWFERLRDRATAPTG